MMLDSVINKNNIEELGNDFTLNDASDITIKNNAIE